MGGDRVRIAVIGAGYWGPNVIRTLRELDGCTVTRVCDRRAGRLQFVAERFPGIPVSRDAHDAIADPSTDAVAIVTPVSTHVPLALSALAAGKHVFVEKPLAPSVAGAEALVEAAAAAGQTLAVGHVFVHHPAVAAMRRALRDGALGRACYAESARVNLGPPESEVDVIWDLAVHDVAILLSLVGHEPQEVLAERRRFVHPSLTDVAFLTLRFAGGFVAQHHVSWLSPVRVRRFTLAGDAGSATFDDTRAEGKLTLAGRGEDSRVGGGGAGSGDLFYRAGDIQTPDLAPVPPLAAELADFLDSIRTGRSPIADGRAGLAVVKVLEAASRAARGD